MKIAEAWFGLGEEAARMIERWRSDALWSKFVGEVKKKIADAVESLRLADLEEADRERRTRCPRSWPARVERRPADVPRRVPWTASLRAFA